MLRSLATLVLGALLAGCGGAARRHGARPGPYDLVPKPVLEELHTVRFLIDETRFEEARKRLVQLSSSQPRNLRIGTLLQDVELSLIAAGGSARGIRADRSKPGDNGVARLFEVYERRATEVPTPAAYVLAARLAPDAETSLALSEQARALDSENPWAHYGRAWAIACLGYHDDARRALAPALRIDPGHLPSLRLEATLLGELGEGQRSDATLRTWFDRAVDDPTIDPARLAEARVDLAIMRVIDGDAKDALALLDGIEHETELTAARAELVRAAALTARGEIRAALDAASRAQAIAPEELLAVVYQAKLVGRFDASAVDELVFWERVLTLVAEQDESVSDAPDDLSPLDFQMLLIQLEARTRLERLRARGAEAGASVGTRAADEP